MKPLGWKNQIDSPLRPTNRVSGPQGQNNISLDRTGWMSGHKNLRLPVGGVVFLLTSPFIELLGTWQSRNETPAQNSTAIACLSWELVNANPKDYPPGAAEAAQRGLEWGRSCYGLYLRGD